MKQIQECGDSRLVHKFRIEFVDDKLMRFIPAGVEGSCGMYYAPGFKETNLVTINLSQIGDQPFNLVISERRLGENIYTNSLYREMR